MCLNRAMFQGVALPLTFCCGYVLGLFSFRLSRNPYTKRLRCLESIRKSMYQQ